MADCFQCMLLHVWFWEGPGSYSGAGRPVRSGTVLPAESLVDAQEVLDAPAQALIGADTEWTTGTEHELELDRLAPSSAPAGPVSLIEDSNRRISGFLSKPSQIHLGFFSANARHP